MRRPRDHSHTDDASGAAFKWKWNIDGGELFEECLRRAKLEGHLPDIMRGCPFSERFLEANSVPVS